MEPLSVDIINQAIDYIEKHLLEKLLPGDISSALYISTTTLNVLFKTLLGLTVMEYIRNRRLSMAAQELYITEQAVIELAYKYGYETPEAFTKAFTRCYGISPSIMRRTAKIPDQFQPIHIVLTQLGGWEREVKLTDSCFMGQENTEKLRYNKSIIQQGGTNMAEAGITRYRGQEVKYHIVTQDMRERKSWDKLLSLAQALDKENIQYKVDGKTMIFAHGLEIPLEKICLTFHWNEEERIKSFFHYEGEQKEQTTENYKFFDTGFMGMKVRCMFFNDISDDGSGSCMFYYAEPVDIDKHIIMVQTLEFYLANAEKETAYYRMVEKYLKDKNCCLS